MDIMPVVAPGRAPKTTAEHQKPLSVSLSFAEIPCHCGLRRFCAVSFLLDREQRRAGATASSALPPPRFCSRAGSPRVAVRVESDDASARSPLFGAGENNLLPALRRLRDLICCCGAATNFFPTGPILLCANCCPADRARSWCGAPPTPSIWHSAPRVRHLSRGNRCALPAGAS